MSSGLSGDLCSMCVMQMARTQRNKATMGHIGLLKARLAKLRRELIEPRGGGGGAGEGVHVRICGVSLLLIIVHPNMVQVLMWQKREMLELDLLVSGIF